MSETADFSEDDQGGTRRLAFSGRLTLARIDDLPARLAALPADRDYAVYLSGVERMDTLGAFLIHRFARERYGRRELEGPPDDMSRVIDKGGKCNQRSDGMRVGKKCGDTCRTWWS